MVRIRAIALLILFAVVEVVGIYFILRGFMFVLRAFGVS